MPPEKNTYRNNDEYIAEFPNDIRLVLEEVRRAVRDAAPEAVETISYSMPAFKLEGILVYFAAFNNHIGFFPTASGVEHFKNELDGYEISKGTIRFPLHKPMPVDLIQRIVAFRVEENLKKAEGRTKRKR